MTQFAREKISTHRALVESGLLALYILSPISDLLCDVTLTRIKEVGT